MHIDPETFDPLGRMLFRASQIWAVLGCLVFLALMGMSMVSIVGRKLASTPIAGDIEMMQMGASFASASFFAYCHLIGGDMKVDFFTARASPRTAHRLDATACLLVGLLGELLAWRTGVGAMALYQAGETSMVLGWPLWMPQALMVPGFFLLGLAGFYKMKIHWCFCQRNGCKT